MTDSDKWLLMRRCTALLPPPGDQVVIECLDEIDALRTEIRVVTAEREAALEWNGPIAQSEPLTDEEISEALNLLNEADDAVEAFRDIAKIYGMRSKAQTKKT